MATSYENIAKVRRRETVPAAEIAAAAVLVPGVATTEQNHALDPHTIAANLARVLGHPVKIEY